MLVDEIETAIGLLLTKQTAWAVATPAVRKLLDVTLASSIVVRFVNIQELTGRIGKLIAISVFGIAKENTHFRCHVFLQSIEH